MNSKTATIWATSGTKLITYNVHTREFEVIGDTIVVMLDIAMSLQGKLYGISDAGLYKISKSTGKSTLLGPLGSGLTTNAITFGPSGTLYGTQGTNLITIDVVTLEVEVLGDMGYSSAGDLVFFNNNLYMASTTDELILINISNPINAYSISEIPTTYGLATVYISEGIGGGYHLYGTSGTDFKVYEIDPHRGFITNTQTIPEFDAGEFSSTFGATSAQFTW